MSFGCYHHDEKKTDVVVVVDVVGQVVVGVEDVGVGLVAPDQSAILEETLARWCSVLTKWLG